MLLAKNRKAKTERYYVKDNLLLQAFRRTQIQHVKRIGNKPAHTLAHHAKGIDDYVTWIEETPPCIEPIGPIGNKPANTFSSKKKKEN